MEHNCNKETDIALIQKEIIDIWRKIKEQDIILSDMKFDFMQIKDMLGTIKFSIQKDNSDVNKTISDGFNAIILQFQKEKIQAKTEVQTRASKKFANKYIERGIIAVLVVATGVLVTALFSLILK